jgi:protein phosphatase
VTLVARHAALTDIGLHRTTNEDAYLDQPPLYAVADGMGGAQAGEVASRLAVETLAEDLAQGVPLHEAARAANAAVYGQARADRAHSGMGTTLTAALLHDDLLEFVHVGDSRIYRLRGGALQQMTDDHSLVGEMVREGHLTREAALAHPQRSILSRALGTESRVEIDRGEIELRPDDVVLLCSDGLYSMVDESTILAVLQTVDDPARAARQLVREAKNAGGHDNVTVVVLRLVAAPQAGADETPTQEHEPVVAGESPASTDEEPGPAVDAAGADAADASDVADAPDAIDASDVADASDAADESTDSGTSPAAVAGAPPVASAAPVPAARRPRRLRIALAVVVVLVAVLVVGAAVADNVYYVGVEGGTVSVYHGLPWSIGGVRFAGLYMKTTYPIDAVAPPWRQRIDSHELHRKAAALELARRAQGLP